jgi:peptidoglycan hydrolase CwlO-like protein
MSKKILILIFVLFIGSGVSLFFFKIKTSQLWEKMPFFSLQKVESDLELQKKLLLKKKDKLAKKWQQLSQELTVKAVQGVEKIEEIQENIEQTKKAFQQTQAAINELESALLKSGVSIGIWNQGSEENNEK